MATEERPSTATDDVLYLGTDPDAQKLLAKQDSKEEVKLSCVIVKINPRDKEQERVLLVTDKAIYNVLPSNYGKCKRRIDISRINSITSSQASKEFVLNVPDEYDYRYKSDNREHICSVISDIYKQLSGRELVMATVPEAALKDRVRTKSAARMFKFQALWKSKLDLQRQQSMVDDTEEEHELATESKEAQDDEPSSPTTPSLPVISSQPAPMVVSSTPVVNTHSPAAGGWETNQAAPARPAMKAPRPHEFQLIKMVGRGCFGKVAQVKRKATGKVYAMKILRKERITQYNQVEHTRAEREIMAMPAHPFLVGLKYAFQTKARLYLVVDFYPRGDLCRYLRIEGQFPEDIARVWTAEIALALGHLHSNNIIYRDLKPENILLHENGHVCLTDFGLAKSVKPKERTRTFCGTPEYLCPEVVNNNGHDRMVDWWTLGIFIYELVTGVTPFFGETPSDICNNVLNGELYMPATVSKTCADFIISLLDRNPKTRLGSKRDVEDIKAHAFFKGVDWVKLMKKEVDPGYIPKIKDAVAAMPSRVSVEVEEDEAAAMRMTMAAADPFKGFEYVAPSAEEEDPVTDIGRQSTASNTTSRPPPSHPNPHKSDTSSNGGSSSSSNHVSSSQQLGSSSLPKNFGSPSSHNSAPAAEKAEKPTPPPPAEKPIPPPPRTTPSNASVTVQPPPPRGPNPSNAHEKVQPPPPSSAAVSSPLSSSRPPPNKSAAAGASSPSSAGVGGAHPQLQPPSIHSVTHRKNPSTSGLSPTAGGAMSPGSSSSSGGGRGAGAAAANGSGPSSPAPSSAPGLQRAKSNEQKPVSKPGVARPPPGATAAAGAPGLGVNSPPISPMTSPATSPGRRDPAQAQERSATMRPSKAGGPPKLGRPTSGSFDHPSTSGGGSTAGGGTGGAGGASGDAKRLASPRKAGGSFGNEPNAISKAITSSSTASGGGGSTAAAASASAQAGTQIPGFAGLKPTGRGAGGAGAGAAGAGAGAGASSAAARAVSPGAGSSGAFPPAGRPGASAAPRPSAKAPPRPNP